MKEKIIAYIATMWLNKHTSGAALFGFAIGAVGIIWPSTAPKCSQLQMLATAYGLAMAADSKKVSAPLLPPKQQP